MGGRVIRTLPHFRNFGLWMTAFALALRLIIAPGFMPVASADGFTIALCSGQNAMSVHISGKSDPAMPSGGSCAYAALAVATAPDVPATLLPSMILAPVAPILIPLIRSPHIGVPAPPPPAIGPPRLI